MARPLRLEFAGALYHVTSRGDRRENIYEDDEDRESFLSVLAQVCKTDNWVCHAYCLMDNHYHLLIETPDSNLSKGMRQLNGVYTQHYNRRHAKTGHVFQGRYKAILIDKDSYLLEVARYIVLNPVRAEIVRAAKDWRWSSYRETAGQRPCPEWLDVEWLLSAFEKRKSTAEQAYRRFVSEGKEQPSPWQKLRNQIYLGDDAFVEKMLKRLDQDKELSEIPSSHRRRPAKTLDRYHKESIDRDGAIITAYASGGYSMREIGDYYGVHYSRISRIISKARIKT